MVSKSRAGAAARVGRLNSKAYLAMFRDTRAAADKALERYGEPQMSLAELRRALDERLGNFSLGDWIVKEREAGW